MMFLGDYLIINSFIRTPAVTTVDGLPPELSGLLVVLGIVLEVSMRFENLNVFYSRPK